MTPRRADDCEHFPLACEDGHDPVTWTPPHDCEVEDHQCWVCGKLGTRHFYLNTSAARLTRRVPFDSNKHCFALITCNQPVFANVSD
jgi:hypothetical protein